MYTDKNIDSADDLAPPKPSSNSCLAKFVAFLTAVIAIVTVFSVVYAYKTYKNTDGLRKPNTVDNIVNKLLGQSYDMNIMPRKYIVDPHYLLPPSDQGKRGTCWDFATMYLMETQYRYNGIKKGFLKENEYVEFSKQAYGAWLGQTCIQHPDVPECKHGAFKYHNTTDDYKIAGLYYMQKQFPELNHSVLPVDVCPYNPQPSGEGDYKCEGMWEAIKKNPLEFTIKNISYAVTVNETKKLILRAQRPIGIGVQITAMDYFAPCSTSSYKDTDACKPENAVNCPDEFEDKKCARVRVRLSDGIFPFHEKHAQTIDIGGHEMDVVGYNDDFVAHSRHYTPENYGKFTGAFILHNSWASAGHSAPYLAGIRSQENEDVICPNHNMPYNWIPVDIDKFKKEKDITQAGDKVALSRVRGKAVVWQPDVLECRNSMYCNKNRNYALKSKSNDAEVSHLFNGLDSVTLISWTGESDDIREEKLDMLPFFALGTAFKPKDLVPNAEKDCGYFALPYETLVMSERRDWSLLDNYHAVDIELEFPDSAYARGPRKDGKDYGPLERSTATWPDPGFEGPLPYKFVY